MVTEAPFSQDGHRAHAPPASRPSLRSRGRSSEAGSAQPGIPGRARWAAVGCVDSPGPGARTVTHGQPRLPASSYSAQHGLHTHLSQRPVQGGSGQVDGGRGTPKTNLALGCCVFPGDNEWEKKSQVLTKGLLLGQESLVVGVSEPVVLFN